MEIKENILSFLKNYRETKATLNMLKLELNGFRGITSAEAIDALTFHHTDSDCVHSSRISNKTASISIHYAEYTKKLNDEARREILVQFTELQQRTSRLETAVNGLPVCECAVITGFYFDHKPVSQLAGELAVAERTIRRYRGTAVDRLVAIYTQYNTLTAGGIKNAHISI